MRRKCCVLFDDVKPGNLDFQGEASFFNVVSRPSATDTSRPHLGEIDGLCAIPSLFHDRFLLLNVPILALRMRESNLRAKAKRKRHFFHYRT